MSNNVKGALWACAMMLPLLFGVGWIADILTRDAVGMIAISHGTDPAPLMKQSILWQMWPVLVAMWLVVSAIVLGLARAGFVGPLHYQNQPPPSVLPEDKP
jgi:hypothetical protein